MQRNREVVLKPRSGDIKHSHPVARICYGNFLSVSVSIIAQWACCICIVMYLVVYCFDGLTLLADIKYIAIDYH